MAARPKQTEEKIFIRLFQQGDEQVFKSIYESCFCGLCKYVVRYVPDEQATADIVQDTFVMLWKMDRRRFNSLSSVRAFLYIAARNHAINYMRRERNLKSKLCRIYNENIPAEDARIIIDAETELRMEKTMGLLPEKCRRVLELSLDGKSYREISKSMNITVNTVRNHRARAVIIFRRLFEHDLKSHNL